MAEAENIEDLRAQIDDIDCQIAKLLLTRTALSQKVAFSKIIDASAAKSEFRFGWRPKREIEILRNLRIAAPELEHKLTYMIWRAMITRNLASQAPMGVVCVKETDAASRIGFGAAVVPQVLPDYQAALAATKKSENLIVSLPWPKQDENWWLELIRPENRQLKIVMALPHYDDEITPEALCLAKVIPLETGKDFSLICAPKNSKLDQSQKIIAKMGEQALFLLKGFFEKLEDINQEIYFLGAYSLV